MSATSERYVCQLSDSVLKQAKEELNEDPQDRLSSVQKLREWIEHQPHINCRTETSFLLRILRTAKFSQLRSREIVEGYMTLKVELPGWYNNWDPREPLLGQFIKSGLFVLLPGYTKHGMKVLIYRYERMNQVITKDISDAHRNAMVMYWLMMMAYCQLDENVQVSGLLYIIDYTNFPMKALKLFSISEMREVMRYQGNVSGRFKGFWLYNPGTIANTVFSLFRPFMKRKLVERVKILSDNLEKLYEEIPKHMLPEEYLPDEYTGPNAGTFDSLTDNLQKELTSEPVLDELLYESSPKWGIDKAKKPSQAPTESFRKLNID